MKSMKLPFRILLVGLSMFLTSCFFLKPARVQKDLTYDDRAWGNVQRGKTYVFVRDYEYRPYGTLKGLYTKGTKIKFTKFEIDCSPRYGKGGCYVWGDVLSGKLAGTRVNSYQLLEYHTPGNKRHRTRIVDINKDILKPAF